jgi:hypothetical protein
MNPKCVRTWCIQKEWSFQKELYMAIQRVAENDTTLNFNMAIEAGSFVETLAIHFVGLNQQVCSPRASE